MSDEKKPLYEDDQLKIVRSEKPFEEHILIIKGVNRRGYLLMHDVLEEIALAKRDKLVQLLDTISQGEIPYHLRKVGLTPEAVGFACSQVYHKKEEEFWGYEKNEFKTRIEHLEEELRKHEEMAMTPHNFE